MTRSGAVSLLFVVVLIASSAVAQQPGPPPHALLRVPRALPANVTAPHGRSIVRSRIVDIDLGPLGRGRASRDVQTAIHERVDVDLFDDAQFRVSLRSVTSGLGDGQVFEGEVEGEAGSSVALAVAGGQVAGNIKVRDRWFQIRYAGERLHAVIEMDESAMGESLEPLTDTTPTPADALPTTASDDGSTIDVLVLYTPSSKTAWGGTTGVINMINTAITETNTAYQNSGVTQRLRLVHSAEVANWLYEGSPVNADNYSFSSALTLLRQTDGVMDEAHTLRNTYGADEVALIINRGDSCGIAYVTAHEGSAFSVVDQNCATGYYSFGHELGHNMGLAHDRANAGSAGAYSYAYGWQNPTGLFRTIMAYACPAGVCPRVQHFSNPTVNYNGLATGSPLGTATEAHAALALNNRANTVANFRASVTPACSYVLSSTTLALSSAGGPGTITVTAPAGCNWTATSGAGFVTITGGATGSGNGTVNYSVAANAAAGRTTTLTIGGRTVSVAQAAPAPANVVAEANAPNSVRISWTAAPGAAAYDIYRRAAGTGFVLMGTTPLTSFDDLAAAANSAYLYRVSASSGGSDLSAADLATTVAFTDDPLLANTVAAKSAHMNELRTAANALRLLAGIGSDAFAESIAAGVPVKAFHITELRTVVDAGRAALSLTNSGYTAGAAVSGSILATHVQEIRSRLK